MEFFLLLSFRLGFSALVGWMGGHRKIGSLRVFALSLFFPLLALGVTALSQYTPAFKQQMKVAAEARAVSRAERKLTVKKAREKVLEQYKSEKEEVMAEKSKAARKDGAGDASATTKVKKADKGADKETSAEVAEKESSKKGRGLLDRVRKAMSSVGGLLVSAVSPELGDDIINDFEGVGVPEGDKRERFLDYIPMDDTLAAKVGFMVHGDASHPSLSELLRPALVDQGIDGYVEMGKPALRILSHFRDVDTPCYSVFCDEKGLRLYRGRKELVRLAVNPGSPLLGVTMDSPLVNMESPFEKAVYDKVMAKDYSGLVDVLSDVSAYLNRGNIDALREMVSGERYDVDDMYAHYPVTFVTGLDGHAYVVAPSDLSPVDMELFRKAVAQEPYFSGADVIPFEKMASAKVSVFDGMSVAGNGVGLQYSPDRLSWFYNPVEGSFVASPNLPMDIHRERYDRYCDFVNQLCRDCKLVVNGEAVNDIYVDKAVTVSYNEGYSDVCYVRYGEDVVAAISFDPRSSSGMRVTYADGIEDIVVSKDASLSDGVAREEVRLKDLLVDFSPERFLSFMKEVSHNLSVADADGLRERVKEVRASVATPEEPEEGYYQEQDRSVGLGI